MKDFSKKNLKWLPIIGWLVVVVVLGIISPSLSNLISEKGAITLPVSYPAQVTKQLDLENNGSSKQIVAVFNVKTGLTKEDETKIANVLNNVSDNKKELHISSITDCFKNTDLKPQMISKNNETVLAIFDVDSKGPISTDIRGKLNKAIKIEGVQTFLTGNSLIEQDVNIASQKGLTIITIITVIFIFAVLYIVFRSIIIPFIPLIIIGISYLVAQFIVALLSGNFNFPISDYTQIFMICILFGIGTDYSILLLSRFREELQGGLNKYEAIKETYKTAGKTILFSATPIFVVFSILYLVQFSLYKSGTAVAIGIVILILALFSLLPSVMGILGEKLFFPAKKREVDKENKLWSSLGNFAFKKPVISTILVLIICIVPILLNNRVESFNLVNLISSKYASVEGFNLISNDFGTGKIAPVTIYIANSNSMKSPEYIETLTKVTDALEKDPEVKSVMSISQPLGSRLNDIYVNNQAKTVSKGLDTGTKDLAKISNGLNNTTDQLNNSKPELSQAMNDIGKLNEGTLKTKTGVTELETALNELNDSITLEKNGANNLKAGVSTAENKLNTLKSGVSQLQQGYEEVGTNLNLASQKINSITTKVNELKAYANNLKSSIDLNRLNSISSSLNSDLTNYIKVNPKALNNQNFKDAITELSKLNETANTYEQKLAEGIQNETNGYIDELNEFNSGMSKLSNAMNELNSKEALVLSGIDEFQSGISQVENGLNALSQGLDKTSAGETEVVEKTPAIAQALDEISSGQSKISSGFEAVKGKLGELSSGLTTGASDINQINSGIKTANGYVKDWGALPFGNTGVYVPDSIFNNSEFKQAENTYQSSNGELATINVTLKENPYTNGAMDQIPVLNNIVKNSIIGTNLSNAKVGESGLISINYNTRSMANHDYNEVVVLVSIGVLIVLILLLRSIIMPIYILLSIILTYFTSIGIVGLIFQKIFGYAGLNWITLFFGFVVLVSLGIDYSIFIITRFKQTEGNGIKESMLGTIKVMGEVIIAAAVILGGTFAALLPSGVLILAEIGSIVIVGILIYVLLILPILIPILAQMFGKANFWPFDKKGKFLYGKKKD